MTTRAADYLFIVSTIVFTVYSQLVMRWQMQGVGPLPADLLDKAGFVLGLLLKPWVLSALAATFLAGVSWMLAMTRFDLSYAYPFVSLVYLLVFAASVLLFREPVTPAKLAGTALVVAGLVVLARG